MSVFLSINRIKTVFICVFEDWVGIHNLKELLTQWLLKKVNQYY